MRDAKWTRALKTDAMLAMTLTLSLSADRTTSADFGADVSQNPIMLSGPVVTGWNATGRDAAYLFAGLVDRTTAGGAPDWTVLTVGAQFNAVNRSGVNQVVFGIATEAWAEQGSFLMLTGLEATIQIGSPTIRGEKSRCGARSKIAPITSTRATTRSRGRWCGSIAPPSARTDDSASHEERPCITRLVISLQRGPHVSPSRSPTRSH